jgi:two-component system response regulator PilR (NtrC family)
LFLDEVADLPLSMQVKLLRAIQEKAVRPVGSQHEDVTDVRVLSATHKDLGSEVGSGSFRQDLYYRLNVIELRIPPLREHVDDIPELADASLTRLARDYGDPVPAISSGAMQLLQAYAFPGNIRELENVLERAFTLCDNQDIQPEDLRLHGDDAPLAAPAQEATSGESSATSSGAHMLPADTSLEDYLEGIERQLITDALESTRWNKTAAAKALGITFRALRYKLKKLDME